MEVNIIQIEQSEWGLARDEKAQVTDKGYSEWMLWGFRSMPLFLHRVHVVVVIEL